MTRSAVALARLIPVPRAGTPDAQLLGAFLATRSEDAFAELVRRYAPMVLATCRRVLGNAHDAEDAFQAVFLVLARKAKAIRGTNLAGWLYAVAVRTARGVRVMRDQRRRRESVVANGRGERATEPTTPDHDLAAVLDEELARLPDHCREAVVLCELRGLPRKEAAAELGIPEGTLSSRLAAARRKLADRLAARGMAPAALAAALVPATVSAGLVTSAVAAVRGFAGPVATAAARVVVKAMLFDQLKAVVLAAGVLLTVACGGWAMSGTPGSNAPAPAPAAAPRAAADPAAELVQQLGAPEFAGREAAAKKLRELGAKAEAALRAGLKSENPEIRDRSASVLKEIRKDALEAVAKEFDPAKEQQPDHPIWRRFKAIAGDSRASRDLFARIIKNPMWLHRLDAAEGGPEPAARQYREALVEVGRRYQSCLKTMFMIYVWPCDTAEEVAFLLLLGSHANTSSARPAGQNPEFEPFVNGEGRIHYARGLGLGLQGKEITPGPKKDYRETAGLTPGSDSAFARLLSAWIERREPTSEVMPPSLWLAAKYGAKEVLPLARAIAADRFPHDKLPPARLYAAALAVVARFGTRDDLPLFERHFKDTMAVATEEPSVPPGAKEPPTVARLDDAALALALLLYDRNPADFGFEKAAKPFRRENGRPTLADYEPIHFGFADDKARADAHAKAKEFLGRQPKPEPKKEEPKPDPAVVKLVDQLGAAEFADREAAAKKLREFGPKAEAALRAGLRSENAEVRDRAGKLIGEIRADAREALARQFDPQKAEKYDHPVWNRFVAIAGDSKAGRELFARIIANKKWLRTLDDAEANPGSAGHIYRVGIAEVFHDFDRDPAKSPPWPCDRPEEVAYLLLLGSHADPNPPAKLTGDEVVPTNIRGKVEFLGRGIIFGEGQITHANGLSQGLEGKWFVWQTSPAAAGTDRVFAKLFSAWLAQRSPSAEVVSNALRVGAGIQEVLPIARRFAANDFEPRRDIPPLVTIKALEFIARMGTPTDLPLFERHFGDETPVAAVDPVRADGAKDYYRPAPVTLKTQLRDVALGLALLLYGASPEDFGFVVRKDTFKQVDGRYPIPWSTQLHLGFDSEASRTAGFKKAKEFLDKQPRPKKEELRPDPVKLAEQLSSAGFAGRVWSLPALGK